MKFVDETYRLHSEEDWWPADVRSRNQVSRGVIYQPIGTPGLFK